ncbi:PrsW family intramembrane metalloprotease [Corynebacterium aquilae]|uniref:PrsW family intramembrane metalloprotease n=1 Tax=Corynebacterium aquilae DSM 44791 TaxID=1431546 RepID=A0A1L7CHN3_9CORY|nr:PrsW family intramembrane metalloprotease [Corynebacterium aquilae]APT85283.1 hypothetical protein CAQU_09605 [Corynebacterium aquilae DSM 44791]
MTATTQPQPHTTHNATAGAHEFFRPQSALWWAYCGLVAVGTSGILIAVSRGFLAAKDALWLTTPLFAITLVLFVMMVLACDPYRARRPWVFALGSLAGGTVATWLSLHGNQAITNVVTALMPDAVGEKWSAAIAGPTTEEWSKMLVIMLVMLIANHTCTRIMHGLLLGGFVGLGFQLFENIIYASNSALSNANSDLSGALSVTVMRSLVGVSSHWLFSAIVGTGVAILVGRSVRQFSLPQRIIRFLGLFLCGYSLHFLWNSPVPEGDMGVVVLVAKVPLIIMVFVIVLRWVWKQERNWLTEVDQKVSADYFAGPGREKENSAGLDFDLSDIRAAIGTRKQRVKVRKKIKSTHGKQAVKELTTRQKHYVDALQAWGRRDSQIDSDIWN